MFRYLTALAAVLALVVGTSAAEKKLTIRWHGQSFFEIVASDGTRHCHGPARHRAVRPAAGQGGSRPDQPPAQRPFAPRCHRKQGDKEKYKVLHGVKEEGRSGYAWNIFDEKVKGIRIYSWHLPRRHARDEARSQHGDGHRGGRLPHRPSRRPRPQAQRQSAQGNRPGRHPHGPGRRHLHPERQRGQGGGRPDQAALRRSCRCTMASRTGTRTC